MSDHRRNITERLGLPQWVADEVHALWPKGSFVLARLVRDRAVDDKFCDKRPDSVRIGFYSDDALQRDKLYNPKEFNPKHFRDMVRDLTIIRDWLGARATMPEALRGEVNLKTTPLSDLVKMSRDWHKTLKVTKKNTKIRQDEARGDIFLTFDNGWYWVNTKLSNSREESDYMGHCGADNGHHIISLRDPDKNSYLTLSRDPHTGKANQFRGHHNSAPSKKYDYYIFKLFEQTVYPITGFKHDRFPMAIMKKYMLDLLEIEHMRDMVMSSEKYLAEIWSLIEFKGLRERDIMRLLMRRQSMITAKDHDVTFFRTIVKLGLHKKPWFDWSWIILDVIGDKTSTREDLQDVFESNWFEPLDDIGDLKKRRGTIMENAIINARSEFFEDILKIAPNALSTATFANVPVPHQSIRDLKIGSTNDGKPFIFSIYDDFDKKALRVALANYFIVADIDAIMKLRNIGVNINLASPEFNLLGGTDGLEDELCKYIELLEAEAKHTYKTYGLKRSIGFTNEAAEIKFNDINARISRLDVLNNTLFGIDIPKRVSIVELDALRKIELEKSKEKKRLQKLEDQRLQELKAEDRRKRQRELSKNYKKVLVNGTIADVTMLLEVPEVVESLVKNDFLLREILNNQSIKSISLIMQKPELNIVLGNQSNLDYVIAIIGDDYTTSNSYNVLRALLDIKGDHEAKVTKILIDVEHKYCRTMQHPNTVFRGNILGMIALSSLHAKKDYMRDRVIDRIPRGLKEYYHIDISEYGGKFKPAPITMVDKQYRTKYKVSLAKKDDMLLRVNACKALIGLHVIQD